MPKKPNKSGDLLSLIERYKALKAKRQQLCTKQCELGDAVYGVDTEIGEALRTIREQHGLEVRLTNDTPPSTAHCSPSLPPEWSRRNW